MNVNKHRERERERETEKETARERDIVLFYVTHAYFHVGASLHATDENSSYLKASYLVRGKNEAAPSLS